MVKPSYALGRLVAGNRTCSCLRVFLPDKRWVGSVRRGSPGSSRTRLELGTCPSQAVFLALGLSYSLGRRHLGH